VWLFFFNPNGRLIGLTARSYLLRWELKMKSYKRVIGIDICTVQLDIADSDSKIEKAVEYTVDAIKTKILKLIKEPSETLVVCEATGGLEYLLVDALHDAKIDVVVANPARVRDFAKGHGYFEKSDAIDAQMLQLYGKQVRVSLAKPRTLEDPGVRGQSP